MDCGTKHFVTRPNICIEAHVMPEHLCPIWITSMTPVQMVTGCDHLVSPVPIHLPVNSSFDTLCPLFVQGASHDRRHFENNTRKKRWAEAFFSSLKSCKTSHHTRYIPQELLTRLWQTVSHESVLLISLLWNLNVQLPFFMAPAQQLNQIYNYCQRQGWQIN